MSLLSEINEQPALLGQFFHNQEDLVREIAHSISRHPIRFVFLAARGTSDNAGRYANYLWASQNRLPLALATPSLFTYYRTPPELDGALVVGISQSGQSPDIISVLEEGKRQGCLTLAITNESDSPLATQANMVLNIQAGVEKAVAATKTYTLELMAIAMLSASLTGNKSQWRQLERVPEWVAQVLTLDQSIASLVQRYTYMHHCVVLGRGYNYSTAHEWALKIKELTYSIAEPYSSADFQHGPIAMVEGGFPVMGVAPKGKVFPTMLEMLGRLRGEHRAELVVISDDRRALSLAQSPIPLPTGIPEWLSPIVSIIPAQLFSYHLSRAKGLDPDKPRTIGKITETH